MRIPSLMRDAMRDEGFHGVVEGRKARRHGLKKNLFYKAYNTKPKIKT